MAYNNEDSKFSVMSDNDLINSYKNGYYAALLELIHRYLPVVEKKIYVKNIVNSDFDDVKQEVLISFINAINSYDYSKKILFSTFVGVCLDNSISNAISKINAKKRQILTHAVCLDEQVDIDVSVLSVSDNPEQIYIDNETYLDLISKIDFHLSEFEKDILFSFLDRKTYDQIAKDFGVSPKTVDNALQRVRRKLKTVFKK